MLGFIVYEKTISGFVLLIMPTDVKNSFKSENGFVQITIPENIESGKINFCYKGTNIEKVSYIISAISLIGFIIYIIYYKKKEA